jgi:hypothetical protein
MDELYNESQSTPTSMMSRSATVGLINYNALMGNGAIVHRNWGIIQRGNNNISILIEIDLQMIVERYLQS